MSMTRLTEENISGGAFAGCIRKFLPDKIPLVRIPKRLLGILSTLSPVATTPPAGTAGVASQSVTGSQGRKQQHCGKQPQLHCHRVEFNLEETGRACAGLAESKDMEYLGEEGNGCRQSKGEMYAFLVFGSLSGQYLIVYSAGTTL